MNHKFQSFLFIIICFIFTAPLFTSCEKGEIDSFNKAFTIDSTKTTENSDIVCEFGYILNDYKVLYDTVRRGESFGEILDRNHVWASEIINIANKAKKIFDVRKLRAGKPYTILAKKDSTEKAQVFIYQHNKANYTIIDFGNKNITAYKEKKKIKIVNKQATGIITSSLSEAISAKGIHPVIANDLSDIYAWTIDFFRLQKNDKFKIIYEEKYIEDSIYVGVGKIKAAYFEHAKKPFYAFQFIPDTTSGIEEYFDEKAGNLRRAFLKAPLKFSRISSRYNLKRRIKLYGNKIKPHLGTDFAAPVGTPIMATANGKVIESKRKRGNGKYVKIRHNNKYETQYLHMKKRNVKVGDYVKQGEVIGWVGMTGYTSGPHVCYRFWRHGKQVDPLREKLPAAKPMKKNIQSKYYKHIESLKKTLDSLEISDASKNKFITEVK